jgi:hypothetical protein
MEAFKTSGNAILKLGFSTFRISRGMPVVESAFAAGYRHVDTAEIEASLGAVLIIAIVLVILLRKGTASGGGAH